MTVKLPERKSIGKTLFCGILLSVANLALAQDNGAAFSPDIPVTDEDSTVTYSASYFDQFELFSVNDMLDRIPGINVARQGGGGGGGGGGPGFSGGSNRRGLGMGGDQVLINGRRIAGKENEGSSQLTRIPASQVDYIEIIRGTSGELDVRGGAQVINIVLLEAETRSSTAYEMNTDYYHDNAFKPGGKVAFSGSRGGFDYLVSAETEPRYEHRIGHETSILADGSPNERIKRISTRKAQPMVLSSNLAWQAGDADLFHLNLQYENDDAPEEARRDILNTKFDPPLVDLELDISDETEDFWEVGGDYEHIFSGGQRWKSLFIVNRRSDHSLRERYLLEDEDRIQDLNLDFANTYEEQILRSSYTFPFGGISDQSLEFGIERALTTLRSNLQLDLLLGSGTSLTPVSASDATVEEIRYESFAVHNWRINDRMSLESTLIFEQSEISQSGDISKSRDFEFLRPKVDYRFDITPALQFRATIEKDVAQLSFGDFTANTDESDDDLDALAGNPDLRQEQSWRYDFNLEYRFDDDNGVLSTNIFYHELIDVIDRVDVSTPTTIQSANGNIGDGERIGMALDGSYRFASIAESRILLTARLQVEDSSVIDPFLRIDRRFSRQGRGSSRIGFRHDFSTSSFNYGFSWNHGLRDNRIAYDIDKIESYNSGDFIILFAELQGWGGLTYRFETFNPIESKRCRVRSRYLGGTIATGYLGEIEDSCSHTGPTLAIKIRGTF